MTRGSKFQTALPVQKITVNYPHPIGLLKKTYCYLNKCDVRTVKHFELGQVGNLL